MHYDQRPTTGREGESMDRTYATVKDLAAYYRLSPNTVRSKVHSGQWPADRIPSTTGKRALIRFSPEQQDEIQEIVRSGDLVRRDTGWLEEALKKMG